MNFYPSRKRAWFKGLALFATGTFLVTLSAPAQVRSFDADWRFLKGDSPGAEQSGFVDSSWRKVAVPHDWSIEGPFDEQAPTRGAGGFLPAGIGWYRKAFELPAADAQRCVYIQFDGVMANSDVWINGVHLGHRPFGYVSFRYDLTGHLQFGAGKTNVLAVRADNSKEPASRWYAGAGIYRHVWLKESDRVHLEGWSTFVTTPKITDTEATVQVSCAVTNQSETIQEAFVRITLVGPSGAKVASGETMRQKITPGRTAGFEQDLIVPQPQRWSLEQTRLYRAVVQVVANGRTLDEEQLTFGIREFKFEPATGFWLNGKNFKLKGVCLHHDASGLGAAVPLGAWERRLTALKQVGGNAIRTSHNPPAPEFLDLCDRLGFLVMDEMFDCWTVGKNTYDYHVYFNDWSKIDARDTVRRDRNHPCIILYSAGNEIHDTPKAELAKGILRGLIEVFHENDPTRPVTQALFRPNVSHDYDNGLAELLDVIGQNYRENEILAAHEAKPERKIVGTENAHDRRVWIACRDNSPYAGQFLWTGFDYLGESRRWPVVAAGSGLFDRVGTPRPRAFQRQSWWSEAPTVYLARRLEPSGSTPADPGFDPLTRRQQEFGDWTPSNQEPHEERVEVYSNCEQVELSLNGKSLGSQSLPADGSPRTWQVPYAPGMLKASGRNGGKEVAMNELHTAGKAARIMLSADCGKLTPAWDDVCYVRATVVDAHGVLVPDAVNPVEFKLDGSGRIAAVDSGDNASHEPFQASERRAFHGICVAILRAEASSGSLTLTASSPGLQTGSVSIELAAP